MIDKYCKYVDAWIFNDYSCSLSKINKFCIMQLLKLNDDKTTVHYIRYGFHTDHGKTIYHVFESEKDASDYYTKYLEIMLKNNWIDVIKIQKLMHDSNIDINKLPTNKISKDLIDSAINILNQLESTILSNDLNN